MTQTDTRFAVSAKPAVATRPPSVLVVLVARDGSAWLRQCLVALSRQTHPRIGVLAVDNGSADGSGDLLESALGSDRVIRLDRNVGFPAAVARALGSEFAAPADYVLLLHDDTLLAPDAITRLVEAAERIDGVGVVGPKVLDWEDPRLLRDIGMSSDRFGYPYSPLEEGEIDQGQYDRVRDVLFVSSCAMLVSRAVWSRIGPPDERFESHQEDLDYCWRARVAGFRVLMTPAAEARHRGASLRGEREGAAHLGSRVRYARERAALAGMLKNYGLLSLLWVLPLYAIQGLARLGALTGSRRFGDAYQVVAAWGWNLVHLPATLARRVKVQAVRSVPDREVRRYMAPAGDRLRKWAAAARQSLLPSAPLASLEEEDGEPAPSVPLRVQIGRLATAHPVGAALMLGVLLGLVAYRNLLGASPLAGGQLQTFPSSPSGFFSELVSGLRHTGLGGSQPASPALGLLGVGSVISVGSPALLEKLLLLGLPAVAGAACYRAVRSATGMVVPAVVSGGCYALSPIVLWAVSQGRISALVFLAGLPWLASKLREAFDPASRTPRLRWAVGAGLGLAVLTSFYPGTLLAAGLGAAVALLVATGGKARARGSLLTLSAAAGAAVLALPVATGVLASEGRVMGDLVGTPSFAELARLSLGPAPGASVVAFFLPAAAALGLVFVARDAARTSLWAVVAGGAAVYLAWLGASGYLPAAMANPVAFVGLAAFSYSLLIGLGLAAVISGVAQHAFGPRQLGAGALVVMLGAGLFAQAAQAAKGSWAVGGAEQLPLAYPLVGQAPGPPYRLLWLGRWAGTGLPPLAGPAQGRLPAGPASVSFAITSPAGASALDAGRPASGPGYDYLRRALEDVLAGETRHGGALLGPLGIRYVVAEPGVLPAAALHRLTTQVDLERIPAGDLVVFRDPESAPLAALVSDASWAMALGRHDFATIASAGGPSKLRPLATTGDALHGSGSGSPAMVFLSQQFDGRWELRTEGGGPTVHPRQAFGWATALPVPEDGAFSIRFGGQGTQDVLLALLASLWAAAMWITRRPVSGG